MRSLFAREFKLGIVVASVNYREIVIFGDVETWQSMVSRKAGSKALFEDIAIAWKHEAKWATEDNAVRMEGNSNWGEAEKHAVDDVGPDFFLGDSRDEAAVFGVDGASGGDVFPFFGFTFVDEFSVARFEVRIALHESAVFDNTATDAGREGKVK